MYLKKKKKKRKKEKTLEFLRSLCRCYVVVTYDYVCHVTILI